MYRPTPRKTSTIAPYPAARCHETGSGAAQGRKSAPDSNGEWMMPQEGDGRDAPEEAGTGDCLPERGAEKGVGVPLGKNPVLFFHFAPPEPFA